jgi:hypothetical protein
VTVQPASGKEMAVVLATTKTKKQNKPASLSHKSVMRKEFRKMAKAVKNQVTTNQNNITVHRFSYYLVYADIVLSWNMICLGTLNVFHINDFVISFV